MSIRLYCPDLAEGVNRLSAEETHHATASLRVRQGDAVCLFDGVGNEGTGTVTQIDRQSLIVDVSKISQRPFELARQITLAVAMGRAHRQGYLIEKCTELGVAAIWPVISERSVAKPVAKSVAKLSRRTVEAAKQSRRTWVPSVADPRPFATILESVGDFDASSVAHPGPDSLPFSEFLSAKPDGASILVWVGPEGGWSQKELQRLADSGVVAASLAPTILRTETAAVAVCAAAAMIQQSIARDGQRD